MVFLFIFKKNRRKSLLGSFICSFLGPSFRILDFQHPESWISPAATSLLQIIIFSKRPGESHSWTILSAHFKVSHPESWISSIHNPRFPLPLFLYSKYSKRTQMRGEQNILIWKIPMEEGEKFPEFGAFLTCHKWSCKTIVELRRDLSHPQVRDKHTPGVWGSHPALGTDPEAQGLYLG